MKRWWQIKGLTYSIRTLFIIGIIGIISIVLGIQAGVSISQFKSNMERKVQEN